MCRRFVSVVKQYVSMMFHVMVKAAREVSLNGTSAIVREALRRLAAARTLIPSDFRGSS
jgi:hypothetical protein